MYIPTMDDMVNHLRHRNVSIMNESHFKKYGILLPLVKVDDELHVLFEVRAAHMRSQPGDICFPGGKKDKEDIDQTACAIRETTEELGIDVEDISSIIPLDYIVSDTGRLIYPFAGYIADGAEININPAEVAEVFTVPLSFFLHTTPKEYHVHLRAEPEKDFPYELIYNGVNYDWQTRNITEIFYEYKDRAIWGLTAKILHHFIILMQTACQEEKG